MIDTSTSSDSMYMIRCSTRQLLCFIILSRFLALNSQAVCVTNKHPLPASSYEAHVYIIDTEILLRVVISTLHQLAKVLDPYIAIYILFKGTPWDETFSMLSLLKI